MALRCKTCGEQNPADNRFCGQCGAALQLLPEDFPRLSSSTATPEAPSADLPPEVIDFDNHIPLLAGNGSDRRVRPPSNLVELAHDHLERESELHDYQKHGVETHFEARARQQAQFDQRADFLRWDNDPSGPCSQPPAEHSTRTGISGPSFLGLTDDRPSQYADEESEPPSHTRRNLALAIMLAAAILAVVQWRSIRDYGLAYIQNGSMRVAQQPKDAPKNPPAVAADNTSRDLGLTPAAPSPGAPASVQGSPNADHNLPVQQADNTPRRASGNAPDPPSSSPPARRPSSMGSPAEPARIQPRQPAPSRPAPQPHLPGTEEMARAANASDAEARAAWLWRAVGKGNPLAQVALAKMYEQGNGVVRSCDQAQVLLRSAAAKGNAEARQGLHDILVRGGCSPR